MIKLFRKIGFPILALIFALVVSVSVLSAQTQSDFDEDGVSDLTTTSANGTQFVWSAKGSSSASEELNKAFGLSSDKISLAHWLDAGTPSLGIIRADTNGKDLVWKVLQPSALISQKTFGKVGDVYLSGADFNGDGITDAAIVHVGKNDLVWTVKYNMFVDSNPTTKRFRFGKPGERVFFMNVDGTRDVAAVFGKGKRRKAKLAFRDVVNGHKSSVQGFKRSLIKEPRPRPFPIENDDGTDVFGLITEDASDTTLYVYDSSGQLLTNPTFPGKGTIAVGNFSASSAGEEIAFQTSTNLSVFNPFDESKLDVTNVNGTLVDEINVDIVQAASTTTLSK